MTKLTKAAIEGWKRDGAQGVEMRRYIFAHEWETLCDLALRGLDQPEADAPTTYKESPEVAAKSARNEWDNLRDFVEVWKLQQAGKWRWYANTRCKYVELRIDMRDGGCIIRDRERVRISPAELAYQYQASPEPQRVQPQEEKP